MVVKFGKVTISIISDVDEDICEDDACVATHSMMSGREIFSLRTIDVALVLL